MFKKLLDFLRPASEYSIEPEDQCIVNDNNIIVPLANDQVLVIYGDFKDASDEAVNDTIVRTLSSLVI